MSEKKNPENQNSMENLAKKYNVPLQTIQQAKDIVELSFKLNPKVVPLMISEAGVGKTPVARSLAKKLGYNFMIIKLANMEKEDITGYIHLCKEGDTYKFVPHDAMIQNMKKGKTLLFFDELNRGDLPTVKSFFNVIDERRFGDYKLPDDTLICAAMNPATKNYNVNDILAEAALRKRFRVICCRADSGTYVNYRGHFIIDDARLVEK